MFDSATASRPWAPAPWARRRSRRPRARKHTTPPRPTIEVRRPQLEFDPEISRDWLHGGVTTLVAHALSPLFPGGERFFIKSVMAFKDQIEDPELLEEIRRFALQEAAHTRAHERYDAAVDAHYGLSEIERRIEQDLDELWQRLRTSRRRRSDGRRVALAITVGLEHFTAVIGRQLLLHADHFDDVPPAFRELWLWHAREEIEHKAVAFDVYEAVGGTWAQRSLMQLVTTASIVSIMFYLVARMLARDRRALDPGAWGEILRFLFVSPGLFTKAIPDFLDYYRPGFHPWDHDDRELLDPTPIRRTTTA